MGSSTAAAAARQQHGQQRQPPPPPIMSTGSSSTRGERHVCLCVYVGVYVGVPVPLPYVGGSGKGVGVGVLCLCFERFPLRDTRIVLFPSNVITLLTTWHGSLFSCTCVYVCMCELCERSEEREVKKNQQLERRSNDTVGFLWASNTASLISTSRVCVFPQCVKACDSHHLLCCRLCMNAKASTRLLFAASFFPRQSLYVSDSKLDRSLYSSSHLRPFASSSTPLSSIEIME